MVSAEKRPTVADLGGNPAAGKVEASLRVVGGAVLSDSELDVVGVVRDGAPNEVSPGGEVGDGNGSVEQGADRLGADGAGEKLYRSGFIKIGKDPAQDRSPRRQSGET